MLKSLTVRITACIIVTVCLHQCSVISIAGGGNNSVMTSRPACAESKSNSLRLKKDLLCDYDSSVRPVVHHSNQTTVYIALFPICLAVDELRHWLKVSSWLVMKWQDEMLTWDPELYGGLDEFYTDTNSIWVPDISVLNTPNQMYSHKGTSYCTVSSSGSVYTAINPVYYAQCTLDFTRWPYDEHACTLILRSRIYRGPALEILLMKANTPDLKFYKPTGNWELVSFTSQRNTKEIYGKMYFASIEYRLVLRRHASSFAAVVVSPAIVLAATVLGILWIQPDCMSRIIFSSICILCHCMFLQYLSNVISNNGDSVPLIVLFYRNSLVVCAVGLIWTVVARSLCSLSNSPYWLYVLTAKFNNNRYFRHFMLASDQNKEVANPHCEDDPSFPIKDTSQQHWRSFTVFVNRLIFSSSLVAYLYFMVTLLP